MQIKLESFSSETVYVLENKELLYSFRVYKKVQQVHKRADG